MVYFSDMKILIVEDEENALGPLSERFKAEGFEVSAARDGVEGLEKATAEQPDLILLDIVMPKMDGMTMMKKLRDSGDYGKSVPIILLTNLSADEEILKGVAEDEPAYYLVKVDWTLDEIVEKVKQRLAG
jgi:DNA-binding response OmpR family regulator